MLKTLLRATEVYRKITDTKKKIVINRGGTSSTKTYSACQLMANWLLTGECRGESIPKGVCSVVRQYSTSLRSSVMRDFLAVCETTEVLNTESDGDVETGKFLIDFVKLNKVEKTFTFGNRIVEFIGADDYNKAKGARREILYCNEADEIHYNVFRQLNMRTKRLTLIDFNPDDEDVWINTELEQKRKIEKGDVDLIISTYLDNPFLTDDQVREIEYLEKDDPMLWQIFGLGEYGKITGLVFPNVDVVPIVPEDAKLVGYGMDFGYTNDPTAMIAVYKYDKGLIFDELIYETGLLNRDIVSRMSALEVSEYDDIVADSAEPKSIAEIKSAGYRCYGAKKGKDSINFGIDTMKSYGMSVTERSVNLRKEFRKYKWKEDKAGRSGNKPIDGFNHGIDAVRYLVMEKMAAKKKSNIFFDTF